MNISKEILPYIDWKKLSKSRKLENDFIIKHKKKINWKVLLEYQQVDEEVIIHCMDKINWELFSKYQDISRFSEKFIDEYGTNFNWNDISIHQKLNEEVIETYKDDLNWYEISARQHLSEAFVEKYSHLIHWRVITSDDFSNEFIIKHFDKFNPRLLATYQDNLSSKVIDLLLALDPFESWDNNAVYESIENRHKVNKEQRQILNAYWHKKFKN